MKIAILVFPGVEELDFVGFLEVLAVANRMMGKTHYKIELVGTDRGLIQCRGGLRVAPDRLLKNLGQHDLLFVPGGGAGGRSGVERLLKDEQVLGAIKESFEKGKRVWSVCTGAFVLAKAGLLRGRNATTHHSYFDRIRDAGAIVVQERVVFDGRITTGGGISSSVDVGLALVEKDLGNKVRTEVQSRMEYHLPQSKSKK